MKTCHDCGVIEGMLHEFGCDMEQCPFCGHQLLSCDCCYKLLGLEDHNIYTKETCYLPAKIYKEGLTDKLYKKWLNILNKKGRISYINYPIICVKCGKLWPDLFMVSNDEWAEFIQPNKRNEVICKECYQYIKKIISICKVTKDIVDILQQKYS